MKSELDILIAFIAKHFVFDEITYPELKEANDTQKLVFALRHSALHFSKTAGKIAAVSEDADHGDPLNIEALREQVSKALINTLRLAELVDMSEADIVRAIEKHFKNTVST
jgi:hypothetical protein